MGLDITAYDQAQLMPEGFVPADDGFPDYIWAFVLDPAFTLSAKGLKLERWYDVSNAKTLTLRAGSYSGYSRFRDRLAEMSGIDDEPDLDLLKDHPFYELVCFADNEGTIGPIAAAALEYDFQQYRGRAKRYFTEQESGKVVSMHKYDEWHEVFKHASKSGLVDFH